MKVRKFNESDRNNNIIFIENNVGYLATLTGNSKDGKVEIDLENKTSKWVNESDIITMEEYESSNFGSTKREYEKALYKLKSTERYLKQIVKFPFYLDGEELKMIDINR